MNEAPQSSQARTPTSHPPPPRPAAPPSGLPGTHLSTQPGIFTLGPNSWEYFLGGGARGKSNMAKAPKPQTSDLLPTAKRQTSQQPDQQVLNNDPVGRNQIHWTLEAACTAASERSSPGSSFAAAPPPHLLPGSVQAHPRSVADQMRKTKHHLV